MPIEPDDLDIPPIPPPGASPAVVTTAPPPPPLRSQLEIVRSGSNARWGAILAGVFVTLATWMVLHLLGVGVGLTAISPDDPDELRSLGIGVGVWSILVPILALLAGGLVASRFAPTPSRLNRMLHGVLVWALTTLVVAVGTFMIATSVMRGAVAVTGGLGDAIGTLGTSSLRGLGLDARDLVEPINARLAAEGKPPVTATQLERVVDDAITASIREGTLDRDTLVTAIAENTALTTADVEELSAEIGAQWQRAAQRAGTLASEARRATLTAADATGKVMLGMSIALLAGLLAAVGGALVTGHHDRRRLA